MTGNCHCGSVFITLPHKPPFVNFCDCSLCAKSGGAWGYFDIRELAIEGETDSYHRADCDAPMVEIHFCPKCGTTTHWVPTEHAESDRAGVNMRIFEPAEVHGIEVRFLNGRNWSGKTPTEHNRPTGKLGVDAFL